MKRANAVRGREKNFFFSVINRADDEVAYSFPRFDVVSGGFGTSVELRKFKVAGNRDVSQIRRG